MGGTTTIASILFNGELGLEHDCVLKCLTGRARRLVTRGILETVSSRDSLFRRHGSRSHHVSGNSSRLVPFNDLHVLKEKPHSQVQPHLQHSQRGTSPFGR